MVLLGVVFTVCLGYLCYQIWYYQNFWGEQFERASVSQLMNRRGADEREISPNRGFIRDRNHQPLAVSSRVYDIVLDVSILDTRRADHKTATLNGLSEVLDIPLRELEALFEKDGDGKLLRPTNWRIVARDVSGTLAMQVNHLRDVYLDSGTQRMYIDPTLAPQTIGFLRGDSAWGLENYYNDDLFGEPGRRYRTFDRENNPVTEETLPLNGYTLVTTLDSGIQRIAQEAVDKAAMSTPCQFAGILVMEPYTGEILAMAQWPSFSLTDPIAPEHFTDRRLRHYWESLDEAERLNEVYKLWGNYHITRTFEPGSIFKPIVVAAALEENVINPQTDSFFCNARVQIYDREIPCWHRFGHGGQDLVQVLAYSCNIAMIDIIGRLGRERFYKYRNDFGFGEQTGIDLPGEASVSSRVVMYALSDLGPVELATSSIGQGFNNTAIQAITAFAAVINGGYVMKPYLVSQIVDENEMVVRENTPVIVRKAISAATSNFMREAMHSVVSEGGTAFRNGNIEGYTIGGKTGSAEQGPRDLNNMTVSYIAYTPVENPEFIILGVLDHLSDPTELSSVTVVPMVTEAMKEIIKYRNMRPSVGDEIMEGRKTAQNSIMSDYSGMPLTEVVRNLNNLGIDYLVSGSGTVVDHHIPAGGQIAPTTAPVYLYLDPASFREDQMAVVPNIVGKTMEQAESYIKEAGFVPVSFRDQPDTPDHFYGDPVTTGASPIEENGETAALGHEYVYKQFPSPGAVITRGTEVKLRVRVE
jgi:stage V sporulation protein D (sporulation-specific penicillin-binding protein)